MGDPIVERRLRFGRVSHLLRHSERAWPRSPCCCSSRRAAGRRPRTRRSPPGEWRTFEGNWTASGTRTSLDLESDHRASIVHLNGSLLLNGENTLGVGFRAEFLGFTDTQSGMVGRAVWTDERGDRVFSELKGEWVGTGNRVAGTFLGGTGRYAGSRANTNSSGGTCWPPKTAP